MVKKVQKAKSVASKPSSSVTKNSRKTKSELKITNGLKDGGTKTVESKGKASKKESYEEVGSSQEEERVAETAVQEVPAEMEDEVPQESSSRKRRAPASSKSGSSTSTKAKKQKVLIEVPKISQITGKVFAIGENGFGQLGFDEDVTERKRPTLLDLPYPIVDIAAGAMHSVCLTANGEIITFGCNDEGALGRITTEDSQEFTPDKVDINEKIVQVSAGDSHSAALSESGHVYIWGNFRNKEGAMGLVEIDLKQVTPVRILNGITVVKISSGSDHLACLSQEGIVYTCGNSEAGQLGRVSEHSSDTGGRRGKTSLITPDQVPIGSISKSVAVNNIWTGSYSTFMKAKGSGTIYACGLNNYEQLGLEDPDIHAASGMEGPLETKSVYKPKEVTSFANRNWLQVQGGLNHTLALDDNGVVYSLGRSEYGPLGLGEGPGDKAVPTAIPLLQDKKCSVISCGNSASFAVTDTGSAFSWGFGTNHQLGHGDDNDRYEPVLIEGRERNFINSWKAVKIAGGGQHTLILAEPRETLEKSK